MSIIQQLLLPCNGSLDITLLERVNASGEEELSLFVGLAELERIPFKREHVLFKMLIGRLYNCGYRLNDLVEKFGPSHKTIRRWGKALLSSDLDYIKKVFGGHENKRKITPEIDGFIRGSFNAIKDNVKNYSQIIINEIGARYNKTISGESLRIIFNDERKSDIETAAFSTMEPDSAERSLNSAKATPASKNINNLNFTEDTIQGSCDSACVRNNSNASFFVNIPVGTNASLDAFSMNCFDQKRENIGHVSELRGTDIVSPPNYIPFFGLPLTGLDEWTEPVLLNHCGLILFSHYIDTLFPEKSFALARQWLSQILIGMINIEQSKHISHESLAKLIGSTIKDLGEQRSGLKTVSDFSSTMELVEKNRAFLGDIEQKVFYYDPHTKEYTGIFKYLKAWIAHSHNVRKGMHSDFIHTVDGAPCFVQIFDNYYDLRERFFICADIFRKSFIGSKNDPVTWIIDRGIYGMETLMQIRASGDNIITWEKDYKRNGWQDDEPFERLTMEKYKNNSEISRTTVFEYQENVWIKNNKFKQIIVKAYKPNGNNIEVSIMVNNECPINAETIIRLMFNKWIQENDFKFLSEFFGIDQITSYRFIPYSRLEDKLHDRLIESKIYKTMVRKRSGLERELTEFIRKRYDISKKYYSKDLKKLDAEKKQRQNLFKKAKQKRCKKESDRLARLINKYPERERKLKNKYDEKFDTVNNLILQTEKMIESLNIEISALIKTESRLQRLIKENYLQPDVSAKNYMDMLKVIARNMFYELLKTFRPLYNNYRDDCSVLREITRLPGIIAKCGTTINIKLWARADYPKGKLNIINEFLQAMSDKINNHFENRSSKIKIEILPSTVQLDKLINGKFRFADFA